MLEHTTDCCGRCHYCKLEPANRVAMQTWLICYHPNINGRKIMTEYYDIEYYKGIPVWCPLESVEE